MAVREACDLVSKFYEMNHMVCDTKSIYDKVYDWYCHSDVTDPEVLAACALEGEKWTPAASYQDMLEMRDYWFPKNPYDEIAIWEIEQARLDLEW